MSTLAPMNRILIVEDDDSLRTALVAVLEAEGFEVDSAYSAELAETLIAESTYACIVSDFRLPGKDGIEFLKSIRKAERQYPFIIMTAYGSIEIAVQGMKEGANDFVCKPFEPEYLISVIKDIIKHERIVHRETLQPSKKQRILLSENKEFNQVVSQAKKVAAVDTSVFIFGESGTGKELLARFIHENSKRDRNLFLAVNCAAIPSELLESEFFGHEAGSFTGATQSRPGILELASDGTVFLDEIGDMPLSLQVKLLRAIQEREIKRVGGTRTIKINPRFIAATNKKFTEILDSGAVREDLYYRLAVVTLELKPLRERPEDIKLLLSHYVKHFSALFDKPALSISTEAQSLLQKYSWPGNARELENVMERAVILADSKIEMQHLGLKFDEVIANLDEATHSLHAVASKAAAIAERDLIERTLRTTNGNKSKTAKILGVSYKTLLSKVKDYELESHP